MDVDFETGNARLLKLADFLETLPRKRFDYDTWVGNDWKGAPDLSCGTTACALGWATTMPELRAEGLHLSGTPTYGWVTHEPTGATGEDAAMEVFGLDYDEAVYLFCPLSDHPNPTVKRDAPAEMATPKQVAKHIRRYVKERKAMVGV